MPEEVVLVISSWYSTCRACGLGADPYEKAHVTRLGYSEHDGKGCGATYTAVAAGMTGIGLEERVQEMRPDLPFVGYA